MQITEHRLKGLFEIQPKVFKDERGYFLESYNQKIFENYGLNMNFVQDNQSYSVQGVVRGLHMQKEPFAQGKLVRVVTGKALDVVVDVRKHSPTFGQWASFVLDSELCNMVYVPPGFAHGFSALQNCIFSYKCTHVYDKASELGILWNDTSLHIDWQVPAPIVSEKDNVLLSFEEFKKINPF
ncbi:MAG: dTDP-4-dehydrorhamnose 3,5-epimerase [Cytophagales bacterium]|nr:dTDP-4-dehydrorhamnose 3,5-epimerase [Cytophagales bacterium]